MLILIVEDNEMNLDMLSRRLEKRGHQVLVATDGASGVERAQENLPSLILNGHEYSDNGWLGSDTTIEVIAGNTSHTDHYAHGSCGGRGW